MIPYLVGSPPIFGMIGVGKSARTPLTLVFSPAMTPLTIVGIDSRFIPWDKLSNLLKS